MSAGRHGAHVAVAQRGAPQRKPPWRQWRVVTLVILLVFDFLAIAGVYVKVIDDEHKAADAAGRPPPRAAFIGDAYTAGRGAADAQFRWTTRLSEAQGWTEINVAKSGTGYFASHADGGACYSSPCPNYVGMIPAAAKAKPEIVVVSGGRNDVLYLDGLVRTSVEEFFRSLRKALPKAKIYVVSPVWDSSPPPSHLGTIATWVKAAAAEVDATYLDIGQPLQGHKDWLAADATPSSADGPPGTDRIHPNSDGHAAIARAVLQAMGRASP